MRIKRNRKSGFTLIEIIISIAILGIFLAGVFSFFQYNLNIFNLGADQSNVQSNIRAASTAITERVRYAAEVKILTESEMNFVLGNTIEFYVNYVYYDAGYIHILSRTRHDKYFVGDGGGIEFDDSSSGKVLNFTITGVGKSRVYNYDAEVKPLNLTYRGLTINSVAAQQAMMFRTPADFMAIDTRPTVSMVSYDSDAKVLVVDFSIDLTTALKVSDSLGADKSTITLLSGNRSIEIALINEPTEPTDGRRIAFDVTADSDGNVFTYAVTYDSDDTDFWVIE